MPKLATTLKTLDGLPEGLSGYYEPVDANDESAGFTLQTDTTGERSRIDDFRSTNIDLRKRLEGLEDRLKGFDGIDERLGGLDKLLKAAKSAEDEASIKSGDIEGLVSRRVSEVVASHESKFTALTNVHQELTTERDGLRQRVGRGAVRDSLMSALDEAKVRIRPGAVDDVLRRTHENWKMGTDDQLVASSGGQVMYGEGGQPMAMKEYVSKMANEAPFFFEAAQGGGSKGSRGGRSPVDTRGKRTIDINDPLAIGRNLDDLLSKKAVLSIDSD